MAETAREIRGQARDALRQAILDAALEQLATVGAAGLSVRQVARQVGLASSAIYRHIPSREALLTELIIAGYDELGAAAEQAEAALPRDDLDGRFRATARAIRRWALEHPHHYALLYGSPVPGYAAPAATIGPATRVALVFACILRDAALRERPAAQDLRRSESSLEPEILEMFLAGVDPDLAREGILAWVTVFGVVSFELFGHLVGSVADSERFFDQTLDSLLVRLSLV